MSTPPERQPGPTAVKDTSLSADDLVDDTLGEVLRDLQIAVAELFYPVYKRYLSGSDLAQTTDQKLREANIPMTTEIYLSLGLGVGALLGSMFGLTTGAMFWMALGDTITLPSIPAAWAPWAPPVLVQIGSVVKVVLAATFVSLTGGSTGMGLGLLTFYYFPKGIANARQREIDILLPEVVSLMYSLSVGGTNHVGLMRKVAESEDSYGEVAVEFQRILKESALLGKDNQNAIRKTAKDTPSEQLSKFLTDMLSILNSGGNMTTFLEERKEQFADQVEREQSKTLDQLEMAGEIYMTLSVLPIILIIIFVVMAVIGSPAPGLIVATVYFLIPFFSVMFALFISMIVPDDPGNGLIRNEGFYEPDNGASNSFLSLGPIEKFGHVTHPMFSKMRRREARLRAEYILAHPVEYFRKNPSHTIFVTFPLSAVALIGGAAVGVVPLTVKGFKDAPLTSTFLAMHVPILLNLVPLAIFYEWNVRTRGRILETLTDDLRKLASTNDTGQTLLESFHITAEDSDSILADEMRVIYEKVQYGHSLREALVEFNNEYRLPRLARTVKLIIKAQEASSHITEVLYTAARASETQDTLQEERKARTQQQVAIIAITFLIFLGILILLKIQFVDTLISVRGSEPSWPDFETMDPELLGIYYLHAATLQGALSGLIVGHMVNNDLRAGAKWGALAVLITAGAWLIATT